jgi:hypothetical protein
MFKFLAMRRISFVSVIKALIFMEPWHLGQSSGSNSKTFLIRRAQVAEGFTIGSGKGEPLVIADNRSLCLAAPLEREE